MLTLKPLTKIVAIKPPNKMIRNNKIKMEMINYENNKHYIIIRFQCLIII